MAAIAQQAIPPDVQTIFAMIDMDGSGGISAPEYHNFIGSLLQNAQVALGPNGDYQGLAFTINQLNNRFNTFPNHEADLPTFYNMLKYWFNTDMADTHPNILGTNGLPGTIAQLKAHLDNILSRMASGELWINPSNFTPTPGFGATVTDVNMGGVNNNNTNLQAALAASLENGGKTPSKEPSQPPPPIPSKKEEEVADCPICQYPITGPALDDPTAQPPGNESLECGHTFHRHCLDAMRNATNNLKCPLCQRQFVGGRKKRRRMSRGKTRRKRTRRKRTRRKKSRRKKSRGKRKSRGKKRTRKN